jgi:PAS domain S-box-containing protein
VEYVNPRFSQIFGYTLDDVPTRDLLRERLYPDPDHRRQVEQIIREWEAHRPERMLYSEQVVTCKDGGQRETIFHTLRGPGGGIFVTIQDVTELKRTESELRARTAYLEQLIESSPEAIAVTDPDGRINRINKEFTNLFGYTPEEALGHETVELICPNQDKASARVNFNKVMTGLNVSLESARRRKDGSLVEVSILGAPIISQGEQIGVFGLYRDISEQKRAEAALKESEERFRELAESIREVFWLFDWERQKVIYVSPAYEDIWGRSRQDLYDRYEEWAESIHPEDLAEAQTSFNEIVEKGPGRPRLYRIIRPDGTVRWISDKGFPILDSQGRVMRIAGLAEDVTQRKLNEEILREREAMLSSIFRSAPIGIGVIAERTLLRANDRLCRMLGYSRDELLGQNTKMLYPSREEYVRVGNELRGRILAGETHGLEARWRTKEGLEIEVLLSSTPIQPGNPEGEVIFTALDISERKEAERKLKKSEQQYRDLIDSITDLIYTHDLEGRFLSANRALAEILGYEPEEIIGRKASEFMKPELKESYESEYLDQINKTGRHQGITQYFTKDGRRCYLEYHSVLVRPEDGPAYVSGSGRDVTERITAQKELGHLEKQLAHAQKMEAIGTLAGGIAHDFNNILSAILGYTELALIELEGGGPVPKMMEQVLTAGKRARNLVRQILSFSRPTEVEKKPTSLGPIIKETLKLLRATLPTTIEIRQELEAGDIPVLVDPTQIHQMLMNLCANSAHALRHKGGILEIRLERVELEAEEAGHYADLEADEYLRLLVIDNGQGMDPGIVDRIYEPFFTTKETGEGSGMGLAVVHGIVRSHGGSITVYSEEGEGTAFHIYLPLIKDLSPIKPVEDKGPPPTGQERILLVDDEEALTEIGQKTLSLLGYKVTVMTSSREALELFRSRPDRFDLVITDQTMPHLTGVELASELLKLRPDLPIILITGFSESISAEKAQSMGIKRFLMKPLMTQQLAETVRAALDDRPDLPPPEPE